MKNSTTCQFCLTVLAVTGTIIFSTMVYAQAPNDECVNAISIPALPYHNAQNTRIATPNASDPVLSCADGGGGKTVWYAFTPDSSGWVEFTSIASTPADYDVAFALYTGTCGNLVEVSCNDDGAGTRQSIVYYFVQAGTTYTLQVAEWEGGGPSGGVPTGGDLVVDVFYQIPPPLFLGPKSGTIASGAVTSTNSFALTRVREQVQERIIKEEERPEFLTPPKNVRKAKAPQGSNYREEVSSTGSIAGISQPVVQTSFQGFPQSPYIPPDPILAVGPNHVMALVNSALRIFDKSGTLLKEISFNSWYQSVHSPVGFSDPQVVYDQFDHRWVMAGINTSSPSQIYLSVSDDDDPIGTWYNWSLPGYKLGDSATANFTDHPHLGFDDQALYITTREFKTSTSRNYSRVRIIPKAQLYANTAGAVTWNDLWDIRDPDVRAIAPDYIKPTIVYGSPGVHFLVSASPYSVGNYISLWTITNPLTAPAITGVNIPTVQYTVPDDPGQAGGGTLVGFGSVIGHKAIYRDSSLWIAHSVASGTGNAYSGVHYVRFNPFTHENLEDVVVGHDGTWSFFPALMVDSNKNAVVTFSRSSKYEYAGVYIAGHRSTDPVGLSSAVLVKAGEAPYSTQRWGDYMGIGLDPVDPNTFWTMAQYASLPADTWGTWIAKSKLSPIPGKSISVDSREIFFPKKVEVGQPGDSTSFTISSNGANSLTVTSIDLADSSFVLTGAPPTPFIIPSLGTQVLHIAFAPKAPGNLVDSIVIHSDDTAHPALAVVVNGSAFNVEPARPRVLYAGSGQLDFEHLRSVDKSTGASTVIGQAGGGYVQFANIRVKPSTGFMYGLVATTYPDAVAYDVVRVNCEAGDVHRLSTVNLSSVKGMAFRDDTAYIARNNGNLYRLNIADGSTTLVMSTGLTLAGLDFNPLTGELWASVRPPSGPAAGNIYKIDLQTHATTLVGTTGYNVPTADIIFDDAGNLFGTVRKTGATTNTLVRIDTSTGAGTDVGSLGAVSVQALAIRPDSIVGSLQFSYVIVDSQKTDSISIVNPGASTLTITSAQTSNPTQFSVTPATASIGGFGNQKFYVTFHPPAIGPTLAGIIFTYDSLSPTGFLRLSGTGVIPASAHMKMNLGWNLVSVPIFENNYSRVNIFPTAISGTFAYQSGNYELRDTLSTAPGYWLKFGSSQTVNSDGYQNSAMSIDVQAGWNLIGSLTAPIPAASIVPHLTAVTSRVFDYNGSYFASDTIFPGRGYWIKVSTPGKLSVSATAALNRGGVASTAPSLSNFSTVSVRDADEHQGRLYFHSKLSGKFSTEYFKPPPVPPAGAFDVRYGPGTTVEFAGEEKSRTIPILVASGRYPLNLSWDTRSDDLQSWLVIDGREIRLNGNGSTKVTSPYSSMSLRMMRTIDLPTTFALHQNYPNPFNPVTSIRYELPGDAEQSATSLYNVSLRIYDALGQVVSTLVDGDQDAGFKSVDWNSGGAASGVYFYRLQATSLAGSRTTYVQVRKMLLLR